MTIEERQEYDKALNTISVLAKENLDLMERVNELNEEIFELKFWADFPEDNDL